MIAVPPPSSIRPYLLPLLSAVCAVTALATAFFFPSGWPLPLFLLLLLFSLLGVAVSLPSSSLFHPAWSRGPLGGSKVALTFDDGPDATHTPAVLDALQRHGVKATFFLVGERVEKNPHLVREILSQGHEVGQHSHSHSLRLSFPSMAFLRDDFDRVQAAIFAATGLRPRFFRPPIGLMNPRIAAELRRRHLVLVAWNVRPRDGVVTDSHLVARRVNQSVRDGSIVLLHDGASPHSSTHRPCAAEALPTILDHLRAAGLTPVTVSELTGEAPYLDDPSPERPS